MSKYIVYVLELKGGNYYVGRIETAGKTVEDRFKEHADGVGAVWTKLHKPLKIYYSIETMDMFAEMNIFYGMASHFGIKKVRGAQYCAVKLSKKDICQINKAIRSANGQCYVCGSSSHYAKQCDKNFSQKVKSTVKLTTQQSIDVQYTKKDTNINSDSDSDSNSDSNSDSDSEELCDSENSEDQNKYNEKGQKHGPWKFIEENDDRIKVCYEGEYINGEKHGLWMAFYNNNETAESGYYVYGNKEGKWCEYYKDGHIKEVSNYDNNLLEGKREMWFPKGRKWRIEFYHKDTLHGNVKEWLSNGVLILEGEYQHGEECGTWKKMHKNGNKMETYIYNGEKREQTLYYANGIKKSRGIYHNGKKCELWVTWYDKFSWRGSDHKESEGEYINDNKVGKWITWYENDNKKSEGEYINDNKVGKWIYWHENGQKESEGEYDNGNKIGKWIYWKTDGWQKIETY